MAFEFNAEQKKKVVELTGKGFSESLAQVAVAAEIGGMSNAVESVAEIVAAMAKEKNPQEADIEAGKKRIREQLKALVGLRDFASIQKSIILKRQLSRLG